MISLSRFVTVRSAFPFSISKRPPLNHFIPPFPRDYLIFGHLTQYQIFPLKLKNAENRIDEFSMFTFIHNSL